MSALVIRQLLEARLATLTPALPTEYENAEFDAPKSGAYQSVNVVLADPDNRVYGDGYHEQSGYLQVLLRYPAGVGMADVGARAEQVRALFARGLTLVQGNVRVTVWRTAAVKDGFAAGDRWCVPVRVPFHAQVFP